MKKIIFAAVSLMMILITISCSNDEINIEKVGKKHNLTLNVGTQGLYDKFNLTYAIRNQFLRDGSRQVGVFVFIYDAKGDLVQNSQSYLNNLNTANLQFKDLVEGKYTVVTLETLVNPDDNYSIETFSFDDTEKLSTLKITEKTEVDNNGVEWPIIAWAPEVIGASTQEVNLYGDSSLDVKPEAIGAVIEFAQYYWEKTDFITIGWSTVDVLGYYSLDPSLDREARYYKNLTVSGNTNTRALFSTDVDPTNYFGIYVLEKDIDWRIVYQDTEVKSQGKVYVSDPVSTQIADGKNYCIATYLGADGYFRFKIFEDQTELSNWKRNLDNEVGPYGGSSATAGYTVPYTNWSVGTVSAVKSYMNEFTLTQDVKWNDSSEKYEMTYFDNAHNMYEYDFTSSTRGLTDAYVFLSTDMFTLSDVREIVANQGYTFKSQNGNNYYYANSTTNVTVYQTEYELILVNYYDPKAYGAAPRHEIPVLKETMALKMKRENKMNMQCATVKSETAKPFNNSVKEAVKKSMLR